MTETTYSIRLRDETAAATKSVTRRLKALDKGLDKLATNTKRANVTSRAFGKAVESATGPVGKLRSRSVSLEKSLERQQIVNRSLTKDFSALGRQITRMGGTINRAEKRMQRFKVAANKTRAGVQGLGREVLFLRRSVSLLVGVLGVREIGRFADAWISVQNRIKLFTGSAVEAIKVQKQLVIAAQESRAGLGATSLLYSRLNIANKALNLSQTDLIKLITTVNQAIAISSPTTLEQTNAIVQLSQALSGATLEWEDLRRIVDTAPALFERIARGLYPNIDNPLHALREGTRGRSEGRPTPKQLATGLLKQSSDVRDQFLLTSRTLGQGLTQVANSFTVLIGRVEKSTGVINTLSTGLSIIANNLGGAILFSVVTGIGLFSGVIARLTGSLSKHLAGKLEQKLAQRTLIAAGGISTLNTGFGGWLKSLGKIILTMGRLIPTTALVVTGISALFFAISKGDEIFAALAKKIATSAEAAENANKTIGVFGDKLNTIIEDLISRRDILQQASTRSGADIDLNALTSVINSLKTITLPVAPSADDAGPGGRANRKQRREFQRSLREVSVGLDSLGINVQTFTKTFEQAESIIKEATKDFLFDVEKSSERAQKLSDDIRLRELTGTEEGSLFQETLDNASRISTAKDAGVFSPEVERLLQRLYEVNVKSIRDGFLGKGPGTSELKRALELDLARIDIERAKISNSIEIERLDQKALILTQTAAIAIAELAGETDIFIKHSRTLHGLRVEESRQAIISSTALAEEVLRKKSLNEERKRSAIVEKAQERLQRLTSNAVRDLNASLGKSRLGDATNQINAISGAIERIRLNAEDTLLKGSTGATFPEQIALQKEFQALIVALDSLEKIQKEVIVTQARTIKFRGNNVVLSGGGFDLAEQTNETREGLQRLVGVVDNNLIPSLANLGALPKSIITGLDVILAAQTGGPLAALAVGLGNVVGLLSSTQKELRSFNDELAGLANKRGGVISALETVNVDAPEIIQGLRDKAFTPLLTVFTNLQEHLNSIGFDGSTVSPNIITNFFDLLLRADQDISRNFASLRLGMLGSTARPEDAPTSVDLGTGITIEGIGVESIADYIQKLFAEAFGRSASLVEIGEEFFKGSEFFEEFRIAVEEATGGLKNLNQALERQVRLKFDREELLLRGQFGGKFAAAGGDVIEQRRLAREFEIQIRALFLRESIETRRLQGSNVRPEVSPAPVIGPRPIPSPLPITAAETEQEMRELNQLTPEISTLSALPGQDETEQEMRELNQLTPEISALLALPGQDEISTYALEWINGPLTQGWKYITDIPSKNIFSPITPTASSLIRFPDALDIIPYSSNWISGSLSRGWKYITDIPSRNIFNPITPDVGNLVRFPDALNIIPYSSNWISGSLSRGWKYITDIPSRNIFNPITPTTNNLVTFPNAFDVISHSINWVGGSLKRGWDIVTNIPSKNIFRSITPTTNNLVTFPNAFDVISHSINWISGSLSRGWKYITDIPSRNIFNPITPTTNNLVTFPNAFDVISHSINWVGGSLKRGWDIVTNIPSKNIFRSITPTTNNLVTFPNAFDVISHSINWISGSLSRGWDIVTNIPSKNIFRSITPTTNNLVTFPNAFDVVSHSVNWVGGSLKRGWDIVTNIPSKNIFRSITPTTNNLVTFPNAFDVISHSVNWVGGSLKRGWDIVTNIPSKNIFRSITPTTNNLVTFPNAFDVISHSVNWVGGSLKRGWDIVTNIPSKNIFRSITPDVGNLVRFPSAFDVISHSVNWVGGSLKQGWGVVTNIPSKNIFRSITPDVGNLVRFPSAFDVISHSVNWVGGSLKQGWGVVTNIPSKDIFLSIAPTAYNLVTFPSAFDVISHSVNWVGGSLKQGWGVVTNIPSKDIFLSIAPTAYDLVSLPAELTIKNRVTSWLPDVSSAWDSSTRNFSVSPVRFTPSQLIALPSASETRAYIDRYHRSVRDRVAEIQITDPIISPEQFVDIYEVVNDNRLI